MSLNQTPSSNRVHIGFFGKTNAGKSSLMNGILGQNLSIVSDIKGTTTDPVQKAMELLPLGPVVMIDTPGLDDETELGKQRIEKSFEILRKIDVAVLVVDGMNLLKAWKKEEEELFSAGEYRLLEEVKERKLPFILAINKSENLSDQEKEKIRQLDERMKTGLFVSAKDSGTITNLKEEIARVKMSQVEQKRLIGDLLQPEDVVILVTPIDEAAPKGRMILPQQQTIRDILDSDAICMVTKEHQLHRTLESLKEPPRLVVTDSQAFQIVDEITPKEILLTSFSILFARMKGNLERQVHGAKAIGNLKDGDTVLISEGCTHHRQCGDIGTEKLPKMLRQFTKKDLHFEFTSGTGFEEDLSRYAVVIHCGGCMLNEQEMQYRLKKAFEQNIPMTNYGVAIAYMKGILDRSLEPFGDLFK